MYTILLLTTIDLFFVVYISKKVRQVLPIITLGTIVYTVSYVLPFYLQFDETSYDIGFFDTDYAFEAVCIYYSFKFAMNIAYYYLFKNNNNHGKSYQPILNANVSILNYSTFFYLIVVAFIIQLIAINDIDQIISPVDRFFSGNPIASNSMTILILILFSVFYVGYLLALQKNRLMLLLSICMCLFYPVLISSRSVVLPFVIMATVQLTVTRNILLASLNFFFSVVFYIAAISSRTELGIGKFIAKIGSAFALLTDFFDIFMMSVSGIATLTATLSGLDSGSIDANPDPFLFLQYISPLPSFWISERIFNYTSLSQYLGIDPLVLGINSDVISESLLWLSWYGPIVLGFILGYIFALIERASVNRTKNVVFTSLFLITSMYFILMSNIAAMRASSRLLVYSYLLFLVFKYLKSRKTSYSLASTVVTQPDVSNK